MSRIKLYRYDRIGMFLTDYYIGQSRTEQVVRLFIGPALIFLGYSIYERTSENVEIAYGAFCLMLGTYYVLKPLFWVLTRWRNYNEVDMEVELTGTAIKLKEKNKELHIKFSEVKKVMERKTYYSLLLKDEQKLYLPIKSLTEEEQSILENNIKS